MTDKPFGQRYTHVYIQRGKPSADSERMRRRLLALYTEYQPIGIAEFLEKKLGVFFYALEFFPKASLEDVLDAITLVFQFRKAKPHAYNNYHYANTWISEVSEIFSEENVAYSIDAAGGIHPKPDEAFARNRASAVAALSGPRYENVSDLFERAHAGLLLSPPDYKSSIRGVFHAAEGLFCLMFPGRNKLVADAVDEELSKAVQRIYVSDSRALRASLRQVKSLQEWVDGAHNYRHEQGSEEISQPPEELAIEMISLGTSFVRWLASIDARLQS
jgi:hypothetical protein